VFWAEAQIFMLAFTFLSTLIRVEPDFCYAYIMNVALPSLPKNLDTLKNLRSLIGKDEALSAAIIRNENINGLRMRAFSANELRLEKIDASQATLEKTDFSDVELFNCDLIATKMPESSWRRVLIDSSRCSGIQLQASMLKDVTFINCKLNVANFRFSKLKHISFRGCTLDEADFYAAELESVDFENCNLDKTEFSNSKLKHVDLRSSEIAGISGIASLAGAIIDSMQLVSLAPLLASEFRIIVKDD
jgi:uncharacterized protein YjbI with pentapeptide repeats